MRVFKKIMYIVLALVPILPLLLFAVCNIGNMNGVEMISFGRFGLVSSVDDETGVIAVTAYVEKDTLSDFIFDGLIPANGYFETYEETVTEEGSFDSPLFPGTYRFYFTTYTDDEQVRFIQRFADIYAWFTELGISTPSYVVFVVAYLVYMVFIHVCFMIFDLIVFVPRKISEILEV